MADRLPPERPWDAAGAADLDAQTLADWIGSRRNVPHPLGRDLTTMAMTLLFSVDPAEVSVLGALVLARGGPRAKRGFEYYTDSSQTETHLIDGDPATVAERIAAALGDDVHVGCPVRHIRHHERGVEVVGDDLTVDADRVIVAAPPSLAARIQFSPSLPAAHNHLMLRMTPGTAIRVITTYEQPFWRASGLCGETSDPRSPVVITIDQCPMSGTPGVLSSYAFGPPAVRLASMSPSDRRGTWLAELAKRFGPQAAEPTGYLETDWTAEEWSRGGMTSHFAPGVLTNYGTATTRTGWPDPLGRRRAGDGDVRADRRCCALWRACGRRGAAGLTISVGTSFRPGRTSRRTGRASPATTACRWPRGTRCRACRRCAASSLVKLCAAPPYRIIRQSTPPSRISSSNAARCSGGMIGSSVPISASTLPLMLLGVLGACRGEAGVEADDGLDVGAAAGQLERHRAAEAVADRRDRDRVGQSAEPSSTSSPALAEARGSVGVAHQRAQLRCHLCRGGSSLPSP